MRRVAALLAVLLCASAALADGAPWRRRRRPDVQVNHEASARVSPSDWPDEPASPARVEPARFASALRELCGWMAPGRAERWTGYVLEHSTAFGEDPFLLGALAHRMGRCRDDAEELGGLGLTSIPRSMYEASIRNGIYRFFVRDGNGRWQERERRVDRFPFAEPRLRRPEENLYFAAALLSVWREQHASVDGAFEQYPHRHYVSHFVWGDRVRSDRAEDRILTDRRRLLEYYGAASPPAPVSFRGVPFGSPLDGSPRVVSSFLGDARDGGAREHRGIDIEAVLGEPVRAVADGRVNFAGVDLPGQRANAILSPEEIESVPRDQLGHGGRYVCILHQASEGWLRTCYMHLETVEVRSGDDVRRGQRIGTVGRTGMRTSAPHLHLELHGPEGVMDGSEALAGLLLGRPSVTVASAR